VPGAAVTANGSATLSVSTDSTGRYTIVAPAGTYRVTASLAFSHSATTSTVVATANATTTRNLALVPTFGTLTGTVTNLVTGAPVPSATVTVFGAGGVFRPTTNASGTYAIPQIPAGSYARLVTASGYFLSSLSPTILAATTTVQNAVLHPF
jgi:bacillopeptidase F